MFSVPLWLTAAGVPAWAQGPADGRFFEVTASPAKATVGDSVTLSFRLRINERDLLTDSVPAPPDELPAGVRVLSVERLRRGSDRVFTGRAVVAFYRPGVREIPPFGVPWVQVVTGHRGLATSAPASVEIVPVLPPGNPTLRDIREPDVPRGAGPLALIGIGAAGAAAAAWLFARRRGQVEAAPAAPAPVAPGPAEPAGPYQRALARLAGVEASRLAHSGEVARHYETVADVLRGYLEEAEGLPARERTTSELLWALPPRLGEAGLRRRLQELLGEADLVKFARARPAVPAAAGYVVAARALLQRWHAAPAAGELDAVR